MFANRADAGRRLADRLEIRADDRPVVLALPRGGVPVAAQVAARLGAPLDVFVVRKIGVPWQPELGFGALAEDGVAVCNDELVAELRLTSRKMETAVAREREELARRVARYRGDRPPIDVAGRVVVLVDDGLATGYTARAAVAALRRRGPRRIVIAVPVAPPDTVQELRGVADEVVVLEEPRWFFAIGEWYADFGQTTDAEVAALLAAAHEGETVGGGVERGGA